MFLLSGVAVMMALAVVGLEHRRIVCSGRGGHQMKLGRDFGVFF